MTTIKQFEEQKQALLNVELREEYGYASTEGEQELHRLINELQPPKPTCVTCLSLTLEDGGITVSCKKSAFISNPIPIMNGCQLKAHYISFGCIHHSDYGDNG